MVRHVTGAGVSDGQHMFACLVLSRDTAALAQPGRVLQRICGTG